MRNLKTARSRAGWSGDTKTCRICQEVKPLTEFSKKKDNRDGLQGACKPCMRAKGREDYAKNREARQRKRQEWRDANPTYFLARDLQRFYGLTLEQYDALLASQGGVCACCGSADPAGRSDNNRFHVDHDHRTGKVRGLLCHKCNTGLGMLGDDVEGLTAALAYLLQAQDVLGEVAHGSL